MRIWLLGNSSSHSKLIVSISKMDPLNKNIIALLFAVLLEGSNQILLIEYARLHLYSIFARKGNFVMTRGSVWNAFLLV